MMKQQIEDNLRLLNNNLCDMEEKGEICLYGGAVMCLVYNARPSTKDVDAVFKPSGKIREAVRQIAEKNGLDEDWLNDGVKGFVVSHRKKILFNWSNLKVYYAEPDYILAMKSISARVDTSDRNDIIFLIKKLKIDSADELFAIIEKYYPKNRIKPATQFFIEEIFDK